MSTIANHAVPESKRIADGLIGMIFLLATEVMFFAGLISAYVVHHASEGVWPPYGQPRLPVDVTAVNTVILLVSGIVLFIFNRKFRKPGNETGSFLPISALILGGIFLIVQGSEWIRLIHFGLTTSSSLYGSFFYLLIGAHGVHVLAGMFILIYLITSLRKKLPVEIKRNRASICSLYWYFVVLIWPVLYLLVYFD